MAGPPATIGPARSPRLIVAAIGILGFGLRASQIGASPLWTDELLQVGVATRDLAGVLAGVRSHAAAAPLDYFGTRLTMTLVGDPVIGPRIWPLMAGTLTIPAAYLAGRAWFGSRAGFAAAALVALSPILVYYSTEARFYALGVLLTLITLWSLRTGPWWVLAVCVAAGLHTMYSFAIIVLMCAVYALRRRAWGRLLAVAIGIAAFIPWALYALPVQAVAHYEWHAPPFAEAMAFAMVAVQGLTAPLIIGAAAAGVASSLAAYALVRYRHAWYLAAAAMAIPVVMWYGATSSGFYWAPRYVILVVPLLLLLAAGGLSTMQRRECIAWGTAYLLLISVPLSIVLTNGVGIK